MRMQHRFCLRQSLSPTYHNLSRHLQDRGWRKTSFNWLAHFNEQHFQFDIQAAECLEFKDLLSQLVVHYCPNVMPMTYCINDQNWISILNHCANNIVWILKPAKLNNGQYIKILQNLQQLENHYLSRNRLGGEHVLQQYIEYPHLLKGPSQGHKYTIRMFVVITNYAGAYLYPHGYFNIALHPYQHNNFIDLSSHLTNEHLQETKHNVVQIPTHQYELFKPLYPQIKSILIATLNALKQLHPQAFICQRQRTLALFGFDFIVDANERVWLLEANHGPCFPIHDEHPLQKTLYYDFWHAVIANFITPIATQQCIKEIEYPYFDPIMNDAH